MAKIKVEIKVPNCEYCEDENTICPMCIEREWGDFRCALFGRKLEIDYDNHNFIRCDRCKQAEVEDEHSND